MPRNKPKFTAGIAVDHQYVHHFPLQPATAVTSTEALAIQQVAAAAAGVSSVSKRRQSSQDEAGEQQSPTSHRRNNAVSTTHATTTATTSSSQQSAYTSQLNKQLYTEYLHHYCHSLGMQPTPAVMATLEQQIPLSSVKQLILFQNNVVVLQPVAVQKIGGVAEETKQEEAQQAAQATNDNSASLAASESSISIIDLTIEQQFDDYYERHVYTLNHLHQSMQHLTQHFIPDTSSVHSSTAVEAENQWLHDIMSEEQQHIFTDEFALTPLCTPERAEQLQRHFYKLLTQQHLQHPQQSSLLRCLKYTPDEWLQLRKLLQQLLCDQHVTELICLVCHYMYWHYEPAVQQPKQEALSDSELQQLSSEIQAKVQRIQAAYRSQRYYTTMLLPILLDSMCCTLHALYYQQYRLYMLEYKQHTLVEQCSTYVDHVFEVDRLVGYKVSQRQTALQSPGRQSARTGIILHATSLQSKLSIDQPISNAGRRIRHIEQQRSKTTRQTQAV